MNQHRLLSAGAALVLTVLIALPATAQSIAQDAARITDLSEMDHRYMNDQRDAMNDLAGRTFGGRFTGETELDIKRLQRLLDENRVRPDQTRELQAMGIILGDLLAKDLGMHWVIYEDKIGRSRALRYRQTEEYLFPVTMISRRREVRNINSVADIYGKAYDIIEAVRPKLPFQ